jgi:hypothetical protein
MLKFDRANLDAGITADVAAAQQKASANPDGVYSGITANMHLTVTTEKGTALCVVVPIQQGQSVPDPADPTKTVYGNSVWGPCPANLRASTYHDPVMPGSTVPGDDGVGEYVWVAEVGYVERASAPDEKVLLAQQIEFLITKYVAKLVPAS